MSPEEFAIAMDRLVADAMAGGLTDAQIRTTLELALCPLDDESPSAGRLIPPICDEG